MQDCYERWDPSTPPGLRTVPADSIPPAQDEVDTSELFRPATRRRYEQDVNYTAAEYRDLLLTYSGHRALPPQQRHGLLTCISTLIEERYAGTVTKRYLRELRVAQRSPAGLEDRSGEIEDPAGQA